MQKKAKTTSNGRITIPREVRRILGLREGDDLIFETDDDGNVHVRPDSDRPERKFARYEGIGRRGKRHDNRRGERFRQWDARPGGVTPAIDTNVFIPVSDVVARLSGFSCRLRAIVTR